MEVQSSVMGSRQWEPCSLLPLSGFLCHGTYWKAHIASYFPCLRKQVPQFSYFRWLCSPSPPCIAHSIELWVCVRVNLWTKTASCINHLLRQCTGMSASSWTWGYAGVSDSEISIHPDSRTLIKMAPEYSTLMALWEMQQIPSVKLACCGDPKPVTYLSYMSARCSHLHILYVIAWASGS